MNYKPSRRFLIVAGGSLIAILAATAIIIAANGGLKISLAEITNPDTWRRWATSGEIRHALRHGSLLKRAPNCGHTNPNTILSSARPCGLDLDEKQAETIVNARLLLSGRDDLHAEVVPSASTETTFAVSILTSHGDLVTTVNMDRNSAAIEGVGY